MANVELCSLEDLEPTPWKNGGGVTRELLVWPEDGSLEEADFLFRISIATIEGDGDFSPMPGFDRLFLPIDGEPFVLEHGKAHAPAKQRVGQVYRFDGEWPTRAKGIQGTATDLNVMIERGAAKASLECLSLGSRRQRIALDPGTHVVLLVLEGRLEARVSNEEEPFELEEDDALWAHEGGRGDEVVLEGRSSNCTVVSVVITER